MSQKDLDERGEDGGYILVDLDRTLARYDSWTKNGKAIGEPVPAMLERVQRWLHTGQEVRIFTARASTGSKVELDAIRAWCKEHVGQELPIQNWKDFKCVAIWDDLAVTVHPNTGWRLSFFETADQDDDVDPLHHHEEWELTKKQGTEVQKGDS